MLAPKPKNKNTSLVSRALHDIVCYWVLIKREEACIRVATLLHLMRWPVGGPLPVLLLAIFLEVESKPEWLRREQDILNAALPSYRRMWEGWGR